MTKLEKALEIVSEVRAMAPYRVLGDLGTWTLHNEGWQRCCDEIERRLKEKL